MAVALGGLVLGLGSTIYGAIQKNKDAKAAAANVRPTYDIPQEEFDAQRLAESQAGQGISAASRQYYQNQADSGLASTNDAILRGGGDANSLGNAYGNYEKGIGSLAVYDDQARMQHLQNLQNSYYRMSADRDKAFQFNKVGPWADKAQALAQKQQADQQFIGSGLNMIGSGVTNFLGGLKKKSPPDDGIGSAGQPNAGMYFGQPLMSGPGDAPVDNGYAPGANANNNFTNNFAQGGGWSWAGGGPMQT